MAEGWFVAQTRPNHEAAVGRRLEDRGFTAFVPRVVSRTMRMGRIVEAGEPLFPTYMFVRLDVGPDSADDRWKLVNSVRSVIGLLPRSDAPSRVSDDDVGGLIDAQRAGRLRKGFDIRPGSRLRVFRGTLANQLVTCLDNRNARVKCLWRCMGTSVVVSVPLNDVTLVQ